MGGCAVSGEQQAQTRSDHPFAKNKGNTSDDVVLSTIYLFANRKAQDNANFICQGSFIISYYYIILFIHFPWFHSPC